MNNKVTAIIAAALIAGVFGIAGGYWFAGLDTAPSETVSDDGGNNEPLFYRNPMNPEITSPVPAKDSMGMDYIPVYADAEDSGPAGTVSIDPVTVQTIGVRTAIAEQREMSRAIETVGRIDYDEQRLVEMNPKTEGWIEELYVDKTGEPVSKGSILLDLYSPQLVASQQEYVLALRNLETLKTSPFDDVRRGAHELVQSSRERLELLDVPEHQIEDLTRTLEVKKGLHIHSPAAGVVTSIGARKGQRVTPMTTLYTIADLSKVWVLIDIYEDELSWVAVGDTAEIRVASLPGQRFRGVLSYIYPYAENQTRTVKARLELDNPELLLKPGMFANVTIGANHVEDAVAVPSEAIVRSGTREKVFVQRAPGKFEPRDVSIGVSSQGWTQIRKGVNPGEQVVVSAQFLIDSESKLREAAAKMWEASDD